MTTHTQRMKQQIITHRNKTANPSVLFIERTKKHLLSEDYAIGKLAYDTGFPDIKDRTFIPPDTRSGTAEPVLCMFLSMLKIDPVTTPHYSHYSNEALLTIILLQLANKNVVTIGLLPNGSLGIRLTEEPLPVLTIVEDSVYKRIKAVYQSRFNKLPFISIVSMIMKKDWLTIADLKIPPQRLENIIIESLTNENLLVSIENELHVPIRGARLMAKTHAFRNFYRIVRPVSRYTIEQQDVTGSMLPWAYMFGLSGRWIDVFSVTDPKNSNRVLINESSYSRIKLTEFLVGWENSMTRIGFET